MEDDLRDNTVYLAKLQEQTERYEGTLLFFQLFFNGMFSSSFLNLL